MVDLARKYDVLVIARNARCAPHQRARLGASVWCWKRPKFYRGATPAIPQHALRP